MKINRILIADENRMIRLGLKEDLTIAFPLIEINEADNCETLFKAISTNQYDLVITDFEMPEKNCFEIVQQIKSLKSYLPILVISHYSENQFALKVLKAGASGCLSKNYHTEDLIAAIERIDLGKKYITPEIAELILDAESDKKPHEFLSNREFEILKLLAIGKSISQISKMLLLALTTVSTHRNRIMHKLKLLNTAEIAGYARKHELITD